MRMTLGGVLIAACVISGAGSAKAQHLWWETDGMKDATCLYGEIVVLATHPEIYYLRRELAPRGARGRLLRDPAQRTGGAADDLLRQKTVIQHD